MAIQYRAAEPNDLVYLLACWLEGARKGERHSFMRDQEYFTFYRHRIIKLLSQSFVRIAYEESAPDLIVGFIVYQFGSDQELVIHWASVRKLMWNCKIAKNLIASVYPDYATKPIVTTSLLVFHNKLGSKYPNFIYNPYALEAA